MKNKNKSGRSTSTDKTGGQRTRAIISGGGTGGHIFPALAIAKALSKRNPKIQILFVGAKNRMEMTKVPEAGYKIFGLPVKGFYRKQLLRNFNVLYRLVQSLFIACVIVKRFRPNVVIGVGGYAGGPVLFAACLYRIPTIIQEQNSYAGVTNRILSKMVDRICVSYEGMERYFPAGKLVVTGNPVRDAFLESITPEQTLLFFDFKQAKPVILVLGGSLGARTLNLSVLGCLDALPPEVHLIWQTGKEYFEKAKQAVAGKNLQDSVKVYKFIDRMELAFAAAHLVVSRAGASTISELCVTGKPCILVPSPNVAEDHQTKNAMMLAGKNAAIVIPDHEAEKELMPAAIRIVQNQEILEPLSENIRKLARFNAASAIAKLAEELTIDD